MKFAAMGSRSGKPEQFVIVLEAGDEPYLDILFEAIRKCDEDLATDFIDALEDFRIVTKQ